MRKGNPLIVFLNSFGSFDTAQSFSQVIGALPEDYGLFAPDYLNTGFSGKSTAPYTLTDEASELAKIINEFKAESVIVVAHSIGGIYAFQMRDKISHLRAFVTIEPTTREIILNPPKEEAYLKAGSISSNDFIHNKMNELFPAQEAAAFWRTTEETSNKFDEAASQNAVEAMQNDEFWRSTAKFEDTVPTIIVTEAYRKAEYARSEYFNHHAASKIIALGSFHYIQWEYPKEIAAVIVNLSK
ncbi:alpha/beta hydrolase [Lactobacillus sp. XV13L]|nr:alpha/beta hydrolase [Lactobacillus sp. XV13L]